MKSAIRNLPSELQNLNPVAFSEFAREVGLCQKLKALTGEGLDLCLLLLFEHGVQFLHPLGALLNVRLLFQRFCTCGKGETAVSAFRVVDRRTGSEGDIGIVLEVHTQMFESPTLKLKSRPSPVIPSPELKRASNLQFV